MDKLELVIHEKQLELQGLQAELEEALTGPESPDYETAVRIQPLIWELRSEIERLMILRQVKPAPKDFPFHLSSLLTDDTRKGLECCIQIKDYWTDSTFSLLEICKLKDRSISCTLRLTEEAYRQLHKEWTHAQLFHIGWKALRGDKTFYYKARMRSPDEFDRFCQLISVTLLEPLAALFGHGRQYYQLR
jgi:hypothetical protein